MKNSILLFIFFASTSLYAQEFHFPKENYTDSTTLAKALPKLVQQIQDSLTQSDTKLSAGANMNLALLSGAYPLAVSYVDSMRLRFENDYKDGVFVPFETFARAKAKQQQAQNMAFRDLFEQQFQETYTALNVPAQEIVEANARIALENLQQSLDATIKQAQTSNTLPLASALRLIRVYNWYWVYSQTASSMQKVVKDYNDKTYDIKTTTVETADGSPLQVHIVRKKGVTKPLPTVFLFNIYADSAQDIAGAKFYAAEHYACVVANTRGKGIPAHEIAPFEHDANDAYAIIDWISHQAWSNGEVGMKGGSYLGFAQWAAVKKLHPALKTIMPQVAVGPGIDYPMHGNVFMSYMLRWIRYVTNNRTTDYRDFSNTHKWNSLYKQWYKEGRSFRSLDSLEGRPSAVFQRWLDHPAYDVFWQNMVPYRADFSKINIPILTTTGYFDDDQMGALYYYKQHHLYAPKANHYLVIGPYTHGGAQLYPQKEVGGYRIDAVAAAVNFRKLSVEWFDYVLKDGPKPELLKDKVNYQVMGTNAWRQASTLRGMSNDTLTFYFDHTQTDDGYTLNTKPSGGYLKQKVDLADRSDATEFEFKVINDPVNVNLPNSVRFISEPFKEPIILSGAFVSTLQVAINKKDFDIVIHAYEVMPDGRYFSLFTAIGFSALQRASYAKDHTQRQLLSPNKKETIAINTSHITSKQLNKGSRLMIALGVNKSPDWQINYGSGKDVSDETLDDARKPLQIKWYGASSIKVPILNVE